MRYVITSSVMWLASLPMNLEMSNLNLARNWQNLPLTMKTTPAYTEVTTVTVIVTYDHSFVLLPWAKRVRQHQSFQQMPQIDIFTLKWQNPLLTILIKAGAQQEVRWRYSDTFSWRRGWCGWMDVYTVGNRSKCLPVIDLSFWWKGLMMGNQIV